jgi:NAD/NADP transhydrogenase alpha subunit
VAVILATLNIVGGVAVTDRMLEMFKGRGQVASQGSGEAEATTGTEDAGGPIRGWLRRLRPQEAASQGASGEPQPAKPEPGRGQGEEPEPPTDEAQA